MSEHGHDNGYDRNGFHYDNCTGPYCNCDNKRYGSSPSSGGGMSILGAVLVTIVAIIITAIIFMPVDNSGGDVPGFVVIIVLIVVGSVLGAVANNLRK